MHYRILAPLAGLCGIALWADANSSGVTFDAVYIADRTVWRRESTALSAFVRIGQGEERFHPFKTYAGFGASREVDEIRTDSHETAIELSYSRSFPGQGLRKRSANRSELPATDLRPTS